MDTPQRWERWAPVPGLVFAASFVTLFFVFFVPGEAAQEGADASQIAEYYRGWGPAGGLLMYSLFGFAGAALLWFTANLYATLRRLESGPGRLSAIAFAGGIASGGLLLAGGAALLAPFTVVALESVDAFDPTLQRVMSALGFTSMNFALWASAVMVVATSRAALGGAGFPRWFPWLGIIVALALLLNIVYFFGFFAWIAWVLLASILLRARSDPSARPEAHEPAGVGPAAERT